MYMSPIDIALDMKTSGVTIKELVLTLSCRYHGN